MLLLIAVSVICLFSEFTDTIVFTELYNEEHECETMIRRIVSEDRATITDDTATRLHSTWLSQECETRVGPEYVIRKYSFFENGTFLLLRHHYADESCSTPAYTIVARGSIKMMSVSVRVLGATEANVRLDSVRLIPYNRQVGHRFGRRLKRKPGCDEIGYEGNSNSGDVAAGEKKWRPYVAQLIYQRRRIDFSSDASLRVHRHRSNSHQIPLPSPRNRRSTFDCLKLLGIEFDELRLLRVEKKRGSSEVAGNRSSARNSTDADKRPAARVELLLGCSRFGRNVRVEETLRPNWLQSTALLRADTIAGCPICGSVFRSTEYSPPLFHETAPLPAVIAGLWFSSRCENIEGGFWSRRFFRIFSGDESRWSARWTYYADSSCSRLFYTVNAAGGYIQRAVQPRVRQRERERGETGSFQKVTDHADHKKASMLLSRLVAPPRNRTEEMDIHRTKLSGRRIIPWSVRRNRFATLPSGTTELELRVTDSLSNLVDRVASIRCDSVAKQPKQLATNNCLPEIVQAPTTLTFKARIGVDWNGDYTLYLASRKDDLWEAPLRRCSAEATVFQNVVRTNIHSHEFLETRLPFLRARVRHERYRSFFCSSSSAPCLFLSSSLLLGHPTALLLLRCFRRQQSPIDQSAM